MKRIFITLIAALLVAVALPAQEEAWEKLADREGVTSVYISKKMFSMMKNIDTGDVILNHVADKIDDMQILTCENKEAAAELRKATEAINPKNGYEELMRIKDEGERVHIYVKENKKSNRYVLLVDDPEDFTLILLNGQLTLEELQGIIQ